MCVPGSPLPSLPPSLEGVLMRLAGHCTLDLPSTPEALSPSLLCFTATARVQVLAFSYPASHGCLQAPSLAFLHPVIHAVLQMSLLKHMSNPITSLSSPLTPGWRTDSGTLYTAPSPVTSPRPQASFPQKTDALTDLQKFRLSSCLRVLHMLFFILEHP